MKATTTLGLVSSFVIVLVSSACATGTQDVTGDNQLNHPNVDSGPQPGADDEGGMLSDDGGSLVKAKNPDAGGGDNSQDAGASSTDAGNDGAAPVDAGMKPDAGCLVTTENLLVNGNLDNGKAPWVLSSASDFASPPALPVTPQSGVTAAWLGGAPNANDYFYQPVVIPANATAAHLKGYRWIATTDIPGADILSIQTRSSGGTKLEELASLSPGSSSSDTKWIAFDYTLPALHAGQTIQIAFIGTTDSSLNTNFFIDSLDLEVTYCKY